MIIGKPGIKNIRNFMAEYFAENEPIFFMDDDNYNVYEYYNDYINKLGTVNSTEEQV